MPDLILVRHAHTAVAADRPSREWGLSPEGIAGARRVADTLTNRGIGLIFTSDEPKAVSTGAILADVLGVETRIVAGLREHDRSGVGYLEADDFARAIRNLFERPDDRVFGNETGSEAADRFAGAIDEIDAALPRDANAACVSHGTVMSLYWARLTDGDGHAFWRQLGMPATITIDRETRAVTEVVTEY